MKGKIPFYAVLFICIISIILNIVLWVNLDSAAEQYPPINQCPPVNSCSSGDCDCENLVNVLCASSCCDGACPGNTNCLDCMDTYGCKEFCENAI